MQTVAQPQNKFSIFNDLITNDHREFYEKITNELIGISPICNQGKSTAAEISETVTEQEQITDLMKRVETFAAELHGGTKNLFDQFYQAKEDFCRSIYCTTAYIKINLIDRTLLERTCDVRWWAMETGFVECLERVNKVSKAIDKVFAEVHEYLEAAKVAFEVPTLETNWTIRDISKQVDDVRAFLDKKLDLMFKASTFEKYRGKVDVLVDQLSKGKGQDGSIKILQKTVKYLEDVHQQVAFACDRLEDVRSSYTLYRDLLLTTPEGIVVANANPEVRQQVLGTSVADQKWLDAALATRDGNDFSIEKVLGGRTSRGDSLVFSTAVRAGGNAAENAIGVMGAFFDLEDEARIILSDYMPRTLNGDVREGWFSFFTDSDGVVVGSSDPEIITTGDYAHLPRSHRKLKQGETASSYIVVEGHESSVFSANSDGYLDFAGMGWSSHLVVPTGDIFGSDESFEISGISPDELMRSRLIPEINKETYVKVQDDKQSIKLISLNGIVFASKLGKRGVALGPVFDQITETGDFATSKMEELLREMAIGELFLNLKTLETFSKQAIDLIDRNLFERSAAIRWWATDTYLWRALQEPSEENQLAASARLRDINSSYSMYRNLVLADRMGRIVTASVPELIPEVKDIRVADHPWFVRAMRSKKSSEYAVQDVGETSLERGNNRSLIYSGGIRQNGKRSGDCIGVLGSLFDWVTESSKILKTCLPKDKNGKRIEGCVAFYTNRDSEVIESTDLNVVPLSVVPELPSEHRELSPGESASGVVQLCGKTYIIGSSHSKGYREYAGLGWSAHILRPLF